MDSDDYSEDMEMSGDKKKGDGKGDAYDYFLKKAKAEKGEDVDDDSPISSDSDDDAESIPSKKEQPKPAPAMDDDDMELSQSPKKKSVQQTAGASVMSGSANYDDADIMEMDDLIEESVEGDMLASGSNQAIQFDHVEVKDPKMEEADKQIEKELEQIPPKFEKTAEKKKPATAAARPVSAAKPGSKPKTAPAAPAKKAAPAKAAPAAKKVPSEKDIANQKKAAARASSKSKADKAAAEAKPTAPPKKKVDPEKLKDNIKKSQQMKQQNLVQSISKLKNFKMPKTTPKLGGTEMDLEKQIEDDIMDLKIQMNTEDFGKKAIEEDQKREIQKSKTKSSKSIAKSVKSAAPSKKSEAPPPEVPPEEEAPEEEAPEEMDEDLNIFDKPEEEEEAGDQNMPDEEEQEEPALFVKEDEEDEGDQNFQVMEPEMTIQPSIKKSVQAASVKSASVKSAAASVKSGSQKSAAASQQQATMATAAETKKPPKAKAPTKKEKQASKLEQGFGVPVANRESQIKEEQRKKAAEAQEKLDALNHQKKLKAKEEMEKLKKMNAGPAEYLKQQKLEAKKGKMNKNIAGFTINDQAGQVDPGIMKGKGSVPVEAGMLYDAEGLQDQLKEIMQELKLLHEDQKQVARNVFDGEQAFAKSKKGLNEILTQKKLLVNKGQLEKEPEPFVDDTNAMIAQVEKQIAKVNPLEVVVQKFAELGWDTEGAFDVLDDDGDCALTIKEIKDGLAKHKIELKPEEWDQFYKTIDANSDGVLTVEEWCEILEPKVTATNDYMKVMGGVNISDPLVIEERILDLQYRNRRLEQELKVLRQQPGGKQDKKKELKKMAEQLLAAEADDLEKTAKAKQVEKELEDKMRSDLMAKDKVQQDFYRLQREKEQSQAEYSMRLEQIQQNLNMLDKKHFDLTQYNIGLKQERDETKNKLFREQIKFQNSQKQLTKLEKQIETIIGKAVTSNDLEMLYQLDLNQINAINTGKSERLNELAQNLAASKIQSVFRGKKQRNDVEVLKFQQRSIANKIGGAYKKKLESSKLGAALIIQRLFRKKQARKSMLTELDEKMKQRNQQKLNQEAYDEKKRKAALTIIRHWRDNKNKKSTSLANVSFILQVQQGKTQGVVHLKDKINCGLCNQNLAIRLCENCTDENKLYCVECFKSYHARGARKRHDRKRIVYDGQDPDANMSVMSNAMSKKGLSEQQSQMSV